MKLNYVYTLFAVFFVALLSLGNSGGRATSANAGSTNAPGDGTNCITCHGNSSDIEVTLDIAMTDGDGNSIDRYVPGTVYNGVVSMEATAGTPAAWGFQIVALNAPQDQDGPSVNTFSNPASNVQIATITSGRQYAEHNGPSDTSSVFRFQWTAPEEGSGTVTFYSCGNGVNGNGGTSGDNAACASFEMTERPVSLADLSREATLTVAPNPVADQLNLSVASQLTGPYTAKLFDATGRQWLTQRVTLTGGTDRFSFPAGDVPTGVYFLQLTNGQRATTMRVVKR